MWLEMTSDQINKLVVFVVEQKIQILFWQFFNFLESLMLDICQLAWAGHSWMPLDWNSSFLLVLALWLCIIIIIIIFYFKSDPPEDLKNEESFDWNIYRFNSI